MTKLTIHEAFAEIKLIESKIEKNLQEGLEYSSREAGYVDPLEKEGGSANFVVARLQAIRDLNDRLIAIKLAMEKANLEHAITIGDKTASVAQWLLFRRFTHYHNAVSKMLRQTRRLNPTTDNDEGFVINFNREELIKTDEKLSQVLSELDSKLSVFNALTVIEF